MGLNSPLPEGYHWIKGLGKDRALLLKFMGQTYGELFPNQGNFAHLADTVAQYFSPETPLWWVATGEEVRVGCLWLGTGVAQESGDRYTHIFLVYVAPKHRNQGIGTALMTLAQQWAESCGHGKIGLQVFEQNRAARRLYDRLGYETRSRLMIKKF
ncbi:GNAT family N-acetyltransferase [Spirulina sp. CS-785/01]|uniref:GNAT family N-acetyltransferase n=1 Tax=Spirulina sp. CS-785/01 TaxID=3021716 RepID=UPI00232CCF24|nr:GNAT family N-acetyltransferase [Spirulina sp. CS-785/01]MDB9315663.1 GNAT family N-acetyltransferase [Spirulina sp. CS-785/01]